MSHPNGAMEIWPQPYEVCKWTDIATYICHFLFFILFTPGVFQTVRCTSLGKVQTGSLHYFHLCTFIFDLWIFKKGVYIKIILREVEWQK